MVARMESQTSRVAHSGGMASSSRAGSPRIHTGRGSDQYTVPGQASNIRPSHEVPERWVPSRMMGGEVNISPETLPNTRSTRRVGKCKSMCVTAQISSTRLHSTAQTSRSSTRCGKVHPGQVWSGLRPGRSCNAPFKTQRSGPCSRRPLCAARSRNHDPIDPRSSTKIPSRHPLQRGENPPVGKLGP